MKPGHILRIARPTDDLDNLVKMYQEELGFQVLARFSGHNGFDGVVLGHHGQPYHLEFTTKRGHTAGRAPSQDQLIIFYIPDADEWSETCNHLLGPGLQRSHHSIRTGMYRAGPLRIPMDTGWFCKIQIG